MLFVKRRGKTDINIGGTYNTNVVTPDEVLHRNLGPVAWLPDDALAPAQDGGAYRALPQSDWVESAVQEAGLQVAIWDLTTAGGVDTAGGYTRSDWQWWTNYYESLAGPGRTSDLAFVYENWSDSGPKPQPQPLLLRSGNPAAAPEPGAALIGLALGPRLRARLALSR
jgi:hypothetical protein